MTKEQVAACLSSAKRDWRPPITFYESLNAEFHFTLDAAASDENHLCAAYFTERENGLAQSWRGHSVFCNPPYGRGSIAKWAEKAYKETQRGGCRLAVLLVPARVNAAWFHDWVYKKAELRFHRGRLHFDNASNPAAFDSMIVIYRGDFVD